MTPSIEEREAIAAALGLAPCAHCLRPCPYCPRLLAARPDLAPGPAPAPAVGPGPLTKAAHFGRALVTHAVAGFPAADEATARARLEICRACDRFDRARTACRACGCHLEVKIRWADQRCPIGKW